MSIKQFKTGSGRNVHALRQTGSFVRPRLILAWSGALIGHLGLVWAFAHGPEQPPSTGAPVQLINAALLAKSPRYDAGRESLQSAGVVVDEASTGQLQSTKAPASKVDADILPDPHRAYYFESRELTKKPLVAVDIPADFLLQVPDAPEQPAVLRLLIGEYGDVDQVIAEDVSLPERARDALVDAFKSIKFHPGEIDGIPVKSQLKITVRLSDPVTDDVANEKSTK